MVILCFGRKKYIDNLGNIVMLKYINVKTFGHYCGHFFTSLNYVGNMVILAYFLKFCIAGYIGYMVILPITL